MNGSRLPKSGGALLRNAVFFAMFSISLAIALAVGTPRAHAAMLNPLHIARVATASQVMGTPITPMQAVRCDAMSGSHLLPVGGVENAAIGIGVRTVLAASSAQSPQLKAILQSVEFDIVPDALLGYGDANYDASTHSVHVPLSFAVQLASSTAQLIALGALSPDGTVRAPAAVARAFTGTRYGNAQHSLAVGVALMVHESVHAWQDCLGTLRSAEQAIQAQPNSATALSTYVRTIELPAQRMQEQTQLSLGALPSQAPWLTMSSDGTQYTDDVAVANMIASHYGDLPSAGNVAGFKFPGFKFPGFKFPGFKFPGFAGN